MTTTTEEINIRPSRKQAIFLASPADIGIYGGAAGGGKTYSLLLETLRHINNGKFGAVVFRRTHPQIVKQGGLWDTACELYPLMEGQPIGKSLWNFPSGAKVEFSHMQYEEDKRSWDSSQIPLICFDELTSFTESQFFYMLSRNRSTCGIKPYIRATCNPETDHWVERFIAWWIDQNTGFPIAERSGVLRWFVRDGGSVVWGDTKEELAKEFPDRDALSVTFVSAVLEDNPYLSQKDPGYRSRLMAMDYVEQARLLGGNWKVRAAAGLKFPRDKWRLYDAVPPGLRLCRYWDKAYTEGGTGARTAGVLIGELLDHLKYGLPRFWIVDVQQGRWGDAEREAKIKATAEIDRATYPQGVVIGLEEEGGAGKHSANMSIMNLAGFDVFKEHPTSKKHLRWSPLAAQQQIGNVAIAKGVWDWATVIRELDALAGDEKLDKGKMRDVADAAAGGFKFLTAGSDLPIGDIIASGDPEYAEEEARPLTKDDITEMPEFLRDLVEGADEIRDGRLPWDRDDD
jgi:phage terminase large subunit-like protein